jgi:biotin transport system substrate-specific component
MLSQSLSLRSFGNASVVFSSLWRVAFGSLFIAACAQIQVPFFLVPMTMQPFALIVVALLMSPALAVSTVAVYILEGTMGLPVFAGLKGGLSILFSPTAGYIVGFLPMVYVISKLKHNLTTVSSRFLVCIIGKVPLYTFGLAWLSSFVGFGVAIKVGLLPFILPAIVSTLFAILSVDLLGRLTKN